MNIDQLNHDLDDIIKMDAWDELLRRMRDRAVSVFLDPHSSAEDLSTAHINIIAVESIIREVESIRSELKI
jgi:hypothetical protein